MFSKSCEYGIKATLFIAQKSESSGRVSLKDIANAINSPAPFTAKILQILSKKDIINSVKGPSGGFEINKEKLSKISLKQIIVAIDGTQLFEGCAIGLDQCDAKKPCPLHENFVEIRNQLDRTLQTSNLLDIAMDLNLGLTILKL
ncbi:Rrf2 family transcriptional regulator [Flavobacteriaceae bacterium]|nr:Rrf2 family transcriptional regulator [Flavobacteriaceae bacterium]MDB3862700.1 Rrf2 family transcriptional regulator [Flavobacteriaceae bacterium]